MVQTSSVVVLAAVALASSVMALPVGNSWEQTLAQQQQTVNKLEQTDAALDRQKATSYAAEAKAFEAAADRFAPPPAAKPQQRPAGTINSDKGHLNARPGTNSRPGQTTGTQNRLETGGRLQQTPAGRVERPAGGPQKSTSPAPRPAGGATQKTAKRLRRALPVTPPAANRPSIQQTLAKQTNVVNNIKQKDAAFDLKEATKLQGEADALRAQAARLEGKPAAPPAAAKPAPARPLTVQEQIAQQNAGINRVEQKFAAEDRQKAKEFMADSSLWNQQANRLSQQANPIRARNTETRKPAQRPQPKPLSVQEQIAQQNAGINRVEQKFAAEDRQKVKEFTTDASLYTQQANRLSQQASGIRPRTQGAESRRPAQRPQAKPLSVQEQIAQQNAGINRVEQKFAAEDRQKVKEFTTDASLYTQQANRLSQQANSVRPRNSDSPDPAGTKNVGNGHGKQFHTGGCIGHTDCSSGYCSMPAGPVGVCTKNPKTRDLGDEVDFYAREWEEMLEELARELGDEEEFYAREWAALEELD